VISPQQRLLLVVDAKSFPSASYRSRKTPLMSEIPASAILTLVLIAAPLAFGSVREWAWGAIALATFLLLLWCSFREARKGVVRFYHSPLYVSSAASLLLGLVQLFGHTTADRFFTREALLKLSLAWLLCFFAGQVLAGATRVPKTKTELREPPDRSLLEMEPVAVLSTPLFRWTVVAYTFLMALFAILQFLSNREMIYWAIRSPGWTFGPYVNHNHYAGLMEMLIPLSVACALPELYRHAVAPAVGAMIFISVVSLLLSGSRGGVLSFLVELLLSAVLVLRFGSPRAQRVVGLTVSAGLLTAAFLFFWIAPEQITERMIRTLRRSNSAELQWDRRLELDRDCLRILHDHPVMGVGLGAFETAFPPYQSFASDFRWDHAHDDYAELLAKTGCLGGAIALVTLAMFFRLSFSNLPARLRSVSGRIQVAAALGCCGILVHSAVDFNLHIPANAAWFAVSAAIATFVPPVQRSPCVPAGRPVLGTPKLGH